jgi:hypothetical protein
MVNSEDPIGHALELARSATPAMARRRTALAAVARPAAEVPGLLVVEVLGSPRARAAAVGLARSPAGWLVGRRPPASAGVEVTTRRVTVVQDADSSVLVHRVEAALVVAHSRSGPRLARRRSVTLGQQGTTAVNEPPAEQPFLPAAAGQATARKALLRQRFKAKPILPPSSGTRRGYQQPAGAGGIATAGAARRDSGRSSNPCAAGGRALRGWSYCAGAMLLFSRNKLSGS